MAKAYWVATYRAVKNPEALTAYVKAAAPAIEAAGGRVLARGMPAKAYELGQLARVVLIEFDSVERASAAYDSAVYQAARKLLGDGIERDIRIIEAAS
ncbi:MAG: DUF1330 domain-containing protein [Hyphomicrobiales bacterium]|nr:DUF1330 domain-containing protein [Hyphomicrobiales bacterium]MBV9519606.1 DUF1330 domain-containing protein [Hyphomicrobiales bacterium]